MTLLGWFINSGWKKVQPIYIDDRVNHGGYHSNPLVTQRGGDTYPRRSTEIS